MKVFSTFSGIGGFEEGILKAWESVTNANSLESSTKDEGSVKLALDNTSSTGASTILNIVEQPAEGTMLCDDSECLICMGRSVSAVKSLSRSSSLSNTETTTDTLIVRNTEQVICTNLRSKNSNQTNTKSSATTATTPKAGMESAPIVVGYSEIDKYARSVYEYHFPNVPNFGDITKINAKELPDFDCLVGGFPCQAFSIAGKRRGFDDTRGTLFFDLARILREKQPRNFVFENVKGLLSHDQGNTFRTIITAIDELGYDCQWSVLNSKNFGVPQNRERVYIVGHLRGTPRPEVFPIGGADEEDTRIVGQDVAYTIDANYAKGTNTLSKGRRSVVEIKQINNPTHSNDRVYASDGISPTLNTMQGGNRQPFVKVPEATKKGYAEATIGQAINLSVPNSRTRRGRVSDIAPTLDTGMQLHTLTEDVRIRRLTPKECERLQGFPDDWTKYGKDDEPISDTQRYKMCGNAVTVNVVQAVFEKLLQIK